MLTWSQRFRLRSWAQASMWLIPMGFVLFAVILALFMPWLDSQIEVEPPFTYGPLAAQATLSAIASGMLVFTGFVLSILTFAAQFGSSSFTPRLMRTLATDTGTKIALGIFVATFIYSLLLLADIDPGGQGEVPQFSILLAIVLVGVSILEFLRMIVSTSAAIRSGLVVSEVGRRGRRVIDGLFPKPAKAPSPPTVEQRGPDAESRAIACAVYGGGVLQAVDVAGIVAIAEDSGAAVALGPDVGDYVPTGATLFTVYGANSDIDERLLHSVALGDERTFHQDPTFAFQILVDIALKALSPAINDPTTAIEALGRIEDLLLLLGSRELPEGVRHDEHGQARLFYRTRTWEEYLSLALTEIRVFGAGSHSFARQMQQVIDELRTEVPAWRREAVEQHARLLEMAVAASETGAGDGRAAQGSAAEISPDA